MQKSIRFPAELADKIRAIAEAEDRTFSYVVVRAMERALGDATGDRIPERPAPPRSTSPAVQEMCPVCGAKPDGMGSRKHEPGCTWQSGPDPRKSAPKAQRRQKASDAMSAALSRQRALNKPKGI